LLDRARAAIAHANYAEAIAMLRQHARHFAHGSLAEERDAMWILALVRSGTRPTRRAATFRRRYPQSIYLQAIDTELNKKR